MVLLYSAWIQEGFGKVIRWDLAKLLYSVLIQRIKEIKEFVKERIEWQKHENSGNATRACHVPMWC